jgi:dolichol-phosphate mannosyltransferase
VFDGRARVTQCSSSVVLSILLPVRNEGINLRIMLKILRAILECQHEVIVIHDHSDDDSIPIVREIQETYPELRLLLNDRGRGVVNAIRSGVEAARGQFVLIFAADEVGPVLAIDDMLMLMNDGCEFVSCTRYAHGGRRLGGSILGGILSRMANRLFHLLCRSPFTDATTGIKMFRRELFDRMQLTSRPVGWAVAFEMAIKAQHAGFKLGEVPIVSVDRLYGGESTFRVGSWTIEYLRWFLWGMREALKQPAPRPARIRCPEYMR